MTRKTGQTSVKPMTEINLTPLIDLSFLLLVTFIITFPVIQNEQGVPVNLPKASAKDLPAGKKHNVTMDDKGGVFLDGNALSLAQLGERMTQVGKVDPTVVILVRADEQLRYGQVVKVMKILYDAKLTKVALVTQAEGTQGR